MTTRIWLLLGVIVLPARGMHQAPQPQTPLSQRAKSAAKSTLSSGYFWTAVIGLGAGLYIKNYIDDAHAQNLAMERDRALRERDQANEAVRVESQGQSALKEENKQFGKELDSLRNMVADFQHKAAQAIADSDTQKEEFKAQFENMFQEFRTEVEAKFNAREQAIDAKIREREALDMQIRKDILDILAINHELKKSNIRTRLRMNLLSGQIATLLKSLKDIAKRHTKEVTADSAH